MTQRPRRNGGSSDAEPKAQELFLVEGESAASAVERVCNGHFQSVLAMQGKPMNAWKATRAKVESNALFEQLIATLGAGLADDFDIEKCRFARIILLFDPDADGIHGCSLMLWFFYRWMPQLLEADRLLVANPPICELLDRTTLRRAYPSHPVQRDKILAEWNAGLPQEDSERFEMRPYRGLASLGQEILYNTCVCPETRLLRRLRTQDALASLKVFGAQR